VFKALKKLKQPKGRLGSSHPIMKV